MAPAFHDIRRNTNFTTDNQYYVAVLEETRIEQGKIYCIICVKSGTSTEAMAKDRMLRHISRNWRHASNSFYQTFVEQMVST